MERSVMPPQAESVVLELKDVRKSYGSNKILDGVSFKIRKEEFVTIVGPSGSGKTTLLRTIAGLQPPSSGETLIEGKVVTEPPVQIAVVFQDYSRSLLPWMTVAENIDLPIRKRMEKGERNKTIDRVLGAVGLQGKGDMHPWQLSGGMQQRVAIARGLAYQPDVLLMDEPFAAVDAQTRIELEDLVLRVRDEFKTTIVFVTHDIDEAVYLADRVIVLSGAPTRVTENIEVDLPFPRDQVETKKLAEYGEIRARVFNLIQNATSHASVVRTPSHTQENI